MPTSPSDPISAPILEVLRVFDELPALRFGDLDRDSLEALAEQVRTQALGVAKLTEELEQARSALADAQHILVARAEQGLQYARVYARGDEELNTRLATIRLAAPRATKKPAAKPAVKAKDGKKARAKKPGASGASRASGGHSEDEAPVEPVVVREDEALVSVAA